MLAMMVGVRILLTEGSSLTSREMVSCLGPAGYWLEVLDPDPLCLARFSRWVRKVHRCPRAGTDPVGYTEVLQRVVALRQIDAVLPTHEQAWLLAAARPLLRTGTRVAVAPAAAFDRVQSKLAFAAVLDELGLPQPEWGTIRQAADLDGRRFPYWLKTPFSTAGHGVQEVIDERSRDAALSRLMRGTSLMAQQPAVGQYGQVQGLFADGRLVAAHTSVQQGVGVGGSAAARVSVDHPRTREDIATLGSALDWHGGLTLDYMHHDGAPQYIECNPRTVEPGNATASGLNLPDLQVRLTLGEQFRGPPLIGRPGVRTHGTIALLLGAAARGESRRSLLGILRDCITHQRLYANSSEQLTPAIRDPPSALPAAFIAARLLLSPQTAHKLATKAIENYSIGPDTIAEVAPSAPA
jgi:hypothetical protein